MMNIEKNKLKNEKIRKLIKELTEELEHDEDLPDKIKIEPVTFFEYYKLDTVRKRFKVVNLKEKLEILREPIDNLAVNFSGSNNIYIFLTAIALHAKKFETNKTESEQLLKLLRIIYHEVGHTYQDVNPEKYNYFERTSITAIEKHLQKNNEIHYLKNHSDYLSEIDADTFAINKIEKYFKEHNLYEEEKNCINTIKTKQQFRKINYDFDKIWEEFYRTYKTETSKTFNNLSPDLAVLLDIFFEENTTNFRSINDICQHENYSILDKEILYKVLTSKPFLKQLSVENLKEEELEFMFEALNYILEEEINKKEFNEDIREKRIINENTLLKANIRISNKLKQLQSLLEELKLRENELIINNARSRK